MTSEPTTHQRVYYQALGAMIDAEAALGADPHPAIRSVTGANAAIAAVIRELLSRRPWWDAEQLRKLLAVVEGPDQAASAPAPLAVVNPACQCRAPIPTDGWPARCSLPKGHDGPHQHTEGASAPVASVAASSVTCGHPKDLFSGSWYCTLPAGHDGPHSYHLGPEA